jgi:ketosteroid isomerase-like protein
LSPVTGGVEMKTIAFLLLTSVALALTGTAQEANLARDLQDLVDTERAFARTATEKGVRDSFLAFIADDGILYRPGPVNGKKWLTDRPARPGLLTWEPVFAEISASGDLGITTGPWEFRPNGPEDIPVGFGQFASVWRKQSDGKWKFVNDIGIDHQKPITTTVPWKLPENFNLKKKDARIDRASGKKAIPALEEKFSKASQKKGMAYPFADYAAEDVRALRSGTFPAIGYKEAVAFEALRTGNRSLTWVPVDADTSASGDLGYSYGSYELKGEKGGASEAGSYLRVWKKQRDGRWKVILDVMSAVK